MFEHVARPVYHLQVHLLFASLVWCAAWALTTLFRASATTKYWVWVATAMNFVLPLGGIIDQFGASHLGWARPLGIIGDEALQVSRIPWVWMAWVLGAVLMLARLGARLWVERDRRSVSGGRPRETRDGFLADGVTVRFAGSRQAPAVDGVLRPHILLPQGIESLLTERELNAVLLHELTHARRRDNLICLVYEIGLCLLWFHPLVWLTGSRLALYRELSCDESVIQGAHGGDLVSALAKLANPEGPVLLQATASSFITHRLAHLAGAAPARPSPAANAALALVFAAILLAGLFETVAHTACCFLTRS
jgi:beta-lactamase regulating signal transducer with metallopeptidase domain